MTERTRLATARETLRARFDEQQQALADYFGLERKAERLRDELSRLEAKMRAELGRLARTTDPATAARLTGAPLSHARAAVGKHSPDTSQQTTDGAGAAPPSRVEEE